MFLHDDSMGPLVQPDDACTFHPIQAVTADDIQAVTADDDDDDEDDDRGVL